MPVISEDEERLQRQQLAAEREQQQANPDPCFEVNARALERFLDGYIDPITRAPAGLPALRQAARAQAHGAALTPILADPSRESWTEFQTRARVHWEAMEFEAESLGVNALERRAMREADRDINWLLRFQLGETNKQIQKKEADSGKAVPLETIRKAVERMATLIELQLRSQQRGRPKQSNQDARTP